MKKLISLALAIILLLSVMAPITAFAENGPYPNDFEQFENMDLENIDITQIMNIKLSAIVFLDLNAIEDAPENAIGLVYPTIDELPLPKAYSGATYDMETNTLTLKNIVAKTATLIVMAMGDDFKIKLEGYNELAGIMSSGREWGGSITLTGNGELVLGRNADALFTGLSISADETASFFRVEDSVKLKFYSNEGYFSPALSVTGSTLTDPAALIQLGGIVVCDEPDFEKYTVEFFEQKEAYDIEWNTLLYYDAAFTKDGVYYVGYEDYNLDTYTATGKYELYTVSYDELLECYVATAYSESPVKPTGFKKIAEYEPAFDSERNCYIGYTDFAEDDPTNTYKYLFYPDYPEFFDLCVDENGTQYGFYKFDYNYEYEDGTVESGTEVYVYNFIEHPVYGTIAIEDTTKNSLDGLTPLKTGEKDYADIYIHSNLVINNGGAVVEPKKITGIELKSTNNGVKISWKADPSADGYRVYRKTSKNGSWKALDTLSADETSFIDKSAVGGKTYYYTVRGYNYVGWGSYNTSGVKTIYLDTPELSASNTSKGVYLKWTKVAGVEKYKIYRQTAGSTKWKYLTSTTKTTYTDKAAKSGTKYTYKVVATAGDYTSSYTTAGRYYLSTPKLSSVKNASGGVKVSWEKVEGAQGYKVYRKTGSGDWKLIATTTNNKKFNYTDKTAKSGKTYSYSVRAYYSKTNSTYNKTGLKLKYVATPVVKVKEYSKSIKLSWNEIAKADEYVIYRKASGESKYTKIATTEKLSYKDTAVKKNKTYSYRVRAVDGSTKSAYKTISVVK